MREVVLDASVVVNWFHLERAGGNEAAHALRVEFEAGELRVLAPPLLWLEVANVAARRWRWPDAQMGRLAAAWRALHFELIEPDPAFVAQWAARGLTAYDAAYVALAKETGAPLITDDAEILRAAPRHATALAV
jgi:predicted nucleic acid-binding protein